MISVYANKNRIQCISIQYHRRSKFLFFLFIGSFLLIRSVHGRLRVRTESQDIFNEFKIQDRIIGGTAVVKNNRYPYIVSLLDGKNRPILGTRIRQFCVGTLVAPDVVLTAAHCQGREGRSPDFVQFNKFYTYTFFEKNNLFAKTYKIIKQVPHPQYNARTEDFDLMLLKMNEKNKRVKPVWLNRKLKLDDGDDVKAVGWGSQEEGGASSRFLRHVTVQYLENEKCNSDEYGYKGRVLDSMICAAGDGKDACAGDSGGPLLSPDPNGDPIRDVQVGVVSWGIGCAREKYPGVYAKIDFQWIMETICDPISGLSPESCLDGVVDCAKI